MSKTLKSILIAFSLIIIGIIFVLIVQDIKNLNKNDPIFLIAYITPAMETLYRIGIALILWGLVVLLYNTNWFSKIFDPNGKKFNLDLEQFKQDESYVAKSGLYTIKRDNQNIVIQRSVKKELKVSIYLVVVIFALIYLADPITTFVLSNFKPHGVIFKNPDTLALMLFVSMVGTFIIYCLAIIFFMIMETLHNTSIILDPMTKEIKYKRHLRKPLKIFGRKIEEITLPLENIESLELTMQQYKALSYYGTKPIEEQAPMITISTNNWIGNEKLLSSLKAQKTKEKLKVIGNTDFTGLNEIMQLLVEYATKGIFSYQNL